jgi:hypothetical protein
MVLLTPAAFRAFLAVWLWQSLENLDGENPVREHVVYTFSPQRGREDSAAARVCARVEQLDEAQRNTLRSLMLTFAERDPSPSIRRYAAKTVSVIDEGEGGAPPR